MMATLFLPREPKLIIRSGLFKPVGAINVSFESARHLLLLLLFFSSFVCTDSNDCVEVSPIVPNIGAREKADKHQRQKRKEERNRIQ